MGEEKKYFQSALSDFTYDAACGGAIRHLADLGYTAAQIAERIDFPVPYKKVQQTIFKYYCEKGILLLKEPDSMEEPESVTYVQECGKFGRKSFRKITEKRETPEKIVWKKILYTDKNVDNFKSYLLEKCRQNEESFSFISCDYGIDVKETEKKLQLLNERQQEYLQGIPWVKARIYHRLDQRMREITAALYAKGAMKDTVYYLKTKEQISFECL